jgi:phosphate transport system ATP-binding protein
MERAFATIDPRSSAKIEQTIDELREDHTIIIVTHNLQQAARVSDFSGFMNLGKMVQFGTVEQVFTKPRDPRTERLVTGRFG